jgi:hypothetical protein
MVTALIILLVLSVYLNFNLISKNERYEEILAVKTDEIDSLVFSYTKILERIREIDARGSFEADDEVGTTFTMLKDAIEEGKEYLIKYSTDDIGTSPR